MATADVHVRPARYTDWQAVSGLLDVFLAQHHRWQPQAFRHAIIGFTPAIFQDWIVQPNELHLVAEIGGKVIGYAGAFRSAGFATDFVMARRQVYVTLLVVAHGAQRNGVGRTLFQAIEDWAEEYEAEVIGLNVDSQNATARAFYAALGYDVANEYRTKTLRRFKRFEADP